MHTENIFALRTGISERNLQACPIIFGTVSAFIWQVCQRQEAGLWQMHWHKSANIRKMKKVKDQAG